MSEVNQDEQIAVLRQELRDGRNGQASISGQDTFRDDNHTDLSARSSVQTPRRNNKKTRGDGRTVTDHNASPKDKPERVRPGSRRFSNHDSSFTSGSPETPTIASHGIERVDAIPERNFDNTLSPQDKTLEEKSSSKLKAEKAVDAAVKVKKTFFKSGRVLSEAEAKEYLEPLASALQDYGEYTDRLLAYRVKQAGIAPVWGDLTLLEATVLARIMIRRAQKNAAAAGVVRNMVEGTDYISAAIIVVPRVMKTAETLQKVPRKAKRGEI